MRFVGPSRRDCAGIYVLAPITALESEISSLGDSGERTGEIGAVLRKISGIDCRLGGSFQGVLGRAWIISAWRRLMGQTAAGTTRGLQCPDCATELEPSRRGLQRRAPAHLSWLWRQVPSFAPGTEQRPSPRSRSRAAGAVHRRSRRSPLASDGAQDPRARLLDGHGGWRPAHARPRRLRSGSARLALQRDRRMGRCRQGPGRRLVPGRDSRP